MHPQTVMSEWTCSLKTHCGKFWFVAIGAMLPGAGNIEILVLRNTTEHWNGLFAVL